MIQGNLKENKRSGINIGRFILPIATIAFLEVTLHIATKFSLDLNIFIPIVFSIPAGIFISLLCSFFSPKVNGIIYSVIMGIITLFFLTQLVYYYIFQGFLDIQTLVGNGGHAVTNFWRNTLSTLLNVSFVLILFALPLIFSIHGIKTKRIVFAQMKLKGIIATFVVTVILHLACLLCLTIGGTGPYSNYSTYFEDRSGTDSRVLRLGALTNVRLEITATLFGDFYKTGDTHYLTHAKDEPKKDPVTSEVIDNKEPDDTEYNVLPIDFDALIEEDTDPRIKRLDEYFKEDRKPTPKNEYTGLFKDCNLIVLCCESFSKYLINEELTPTLFKLSHEGFIFNNYYSPFDSNTTNGEYSFCMGYFPDLSRSKVENSFIASSDNYLPFTYANMFATRGIKSYAYHNYFGTYYSRNISHKNMGYNFKAPDSGLEIPVSWPSSDYDMMVASVDDYINSGEQFHAYYMTFSGHFQYNWDNPMSEKNHDLVTDLGYESSAVQAYIACNLELEKALSYLMTRLEEAGIADNTVIVLTNDHYPYGLSETEYNELAGQEVDVEFGRYRNSFICWYGGFSQPKVIDTPCCSIDILPTMLNLFGFDYDSRLLWGRDILADCEHVAILANKSFVNEYMLLDGNTGKYTLINSISDDADDPDAYTSTADGVTELTDDMIEYWKAYVDDTFTIAKDILDTNYFEHLRKYIDKDPPAEDTQETSDADSITAAVTDENN